MSIFVLSSRLPQQGKDTLCEYLRKSYGVKRVSMADSLKEICYSGGWDGEKDEKGRRLLIDIGMAFRKFDEDTWIKIAIDKIKKEIKEGYAVCITDCRFLNEINILRKEFTRTPIIHIGIDSYILGDHERENDVSQIDFHKMKFDHKVITNTNKDVLYRQIEDIIATIHGDIGGLDENK